MREVKVAPGRRATAAGADRGRARARSRRPPRRRGADRKALVARPTRRSYGYATVGVTWEHGASSPRTTSPSGPHPRSGALVGLDGGCSTTTSTAPTPTAAEAERAARPGTDAVVVGDVDEVQMRAETTRPAGRPPTCSSP